MMSLSKLCATVAVTGLMIAGPITSAMAGDYCTCTWSGDSKTFNPSTKEQCAQHKADLKKDHPGVQCTFCQPLKMTPGVAGATPNAAVGSCSIMPDVATTLDPLSTM